MNWIGDKNVYAIWALTYQISVIIMMVLQWWKMVFNSEKFILTISDQVLEIFRQFVQDSMKKNEAGGI